MNARTKSSRKQPVGQAQSGERVLIVAERGASYTSHVESLVAQGAHVVALVRRADETVQGLRARIERILADGEAPTRAFLIAGAEKPADRLEILRAVISKLPVRANLVLCPGADANKDIARALLALSLTVREMVAGVEVCVEHCEHESKEHRAWRRRIDRALDTLTRPSGGLRAPSEDVAA
jgi:hypothetical protein